MIVEDKVIDCCNFVYGWRGDILQYVCIKCIDDNLICCKEKIRYEQFIWNLGLYYNSCGDIWKDYKILCVEWGVSFWDLDIIEDLDIFFVFDFEDN